MTMRFGRRVILQSIMAAGLVAVVGLVGILLIVAVIS
jgi:hypothetical protein